MPAHPLDRKTQEASVGGAGPDTAPEMQGEGDYIAARRHRQSVERFVATGGVDRAARAAAPETPEQARELLVAEEAGRSRARR